MLDDSIIFKSYDASVVRDERDGQDSHTTPRAPHLLETHQPCPIRLQWKQKPPDDHFQRQQHHHLHTQFHSGQRPGHAATLITSPSLSGGISEQKHHAPSYDKDTGLHPLVASASSHACHRSSATPTKPAVLIPLQTGQRPEGVQDLRMASRRYEAQSLESLNVDSAYAWSPPSAKAEIGDHKRRDSSNSEPKKDTVSLDTDDTSEETSSDLRLFQAAHSGGELCEVFGSMVLDRHGLHCFGSSAHFSLFRKNSGFRQGFDEGAWPHSPHTECETDLPPKKEMDYLLDLYFKHVYPFSPMLIRKTFMREYRQQRPTLPMIMLLNAIFSVACMYSDDPAIKKGATQYFGRAKLLLDETYHVSTIETIQALIMMSHHQISHGAPLGRYMYSGMALRMAYDKGLHHPTTELEDPEQYAIRNRLWWVLYILEQLGSAIGGRPISLRDKDFSVKDPSDDWIPQVIGEEDTADPQFESERLISCRLLWTIKLARILGEIMDTVYSVKADSSARYRAKLFKAQVPRLHNALTSWLLDLPKELAYAAYPSLAPSSDQRSPYPTALMHMLCHFASIALHVPHFRDLDDSTAHDTTVATATSVCVAAANNIGHILDSLMLHGHLKDSTLFTISYIIYSNKVFLQYATIKAAAARRTALLGLGRVIRITLELIKTYPGAEVILSSCCDHLSQLGQSVDMTFNGGSDTHEESHPLRGLAQPNSARLKDIYDASRNAESSTDGSEAARSMHLRHPSLKFSAPLRNEGVSGEASASYQQQIESAIAIAATAFGAPDPRQGCSPPVKVPNALPKTWQLETMGFMSVNSASPEAVPQEQGVIVCGHASYVSTRS